jgi:hypothetical protein
MDYYEELGLTAAASPEQIRQAYKNLARLLHPDQQADEPLRSLAELQMKRLNGIYEVLSDPARRREYDRALTLAAKARPLAHWRQWWQRAPSDVRVALGLAGVTLAAGGLYWIFTADWKPHPQAVSGAWAPPAAVAEARPSAPKPLITELDYLRRRVRALEAERDAPRAQLRAAEAKPLVASPPGGAPRVTLPEPPPVADPRPVETASAPRLPAPGLVSAPPGQRGRAGVARFAGTWFYVPTRLAPEAKALYPPEYIEAVIVEEGGVLRGRYYGRYRVTDRAISPEVRFYFEGPAQADQAVLEWQGGGGARGEVRLKLLGENALEVNWSATDLGRAPGLAAGTAALVRRIE